MARAKNLGDAIAAMIAAHGNLDAAFQNYDAAVRGSQHGAALTAYKEAHKAVLGLKDALNGTYAHLSELRPKKADKLKPGNKLDNAPAGTKKDQKADKRRADRAEKAAAEQDLTGPALPLRSNKKRAEKATTNRARKAGRQVEEAEPAMSEPGDDAPIDPDDGADPDAP